MLMTSLRRTGWDSRMVQSQVKCWLCKHEVLRWVTRIDPQTWVCGMVVCVCHHSASQAEIAPSLGFSDKLV